MDKMTAIPLRKQIAMGMQCDGMSMKSGSGGKKKPMKKAKPMGKKSGRRAY